MSIFNIFGDANKKYIEGLGSTIEKINSLERDLEKLSNEELKGKTEELKKELAQEKSLDDILPPAFALVREASKRNLKQRHFDVQLIGGIVLHQGKVAEMKTGEGKTLAATLPAYLNALEGKGVHIITVNDYLAKRDTVWMGQIYNALGLTVGCITNESGYIYDADYKSADKERDIVGGFKVVQEFLRPCSKKEAYNTDITYGTNHEFGFDYLRDNMVYPVRNEISNGVYDIPTMQRGYNFAIVDEVDSILIDEARVPLIISGKSEESTDKYYQFAKIASFLKEKDPSSQAGDYEIDEKLKTAVFTEQGQDKVVKNLGFDPWQENDIGTTHQLESALRAKALFLKDRDYVVRDGEIVIIDEFTGRMLKGRRWSNGLHQAVEAKEGVQIKAESQTLATITFQNYFRLYKKIAGMTGTAQTSAEELDKVYKLDVVSIPTNKPMQRKDFSDRIYKTEAGKLKAVVRDIKELYKKGQPVLVGTRSVEKNEYLGKLLEVEGIPHQILNAKNHEREGEIIAQAGQEAAVTIATNMAGRGVDIILGGNPQNSERSQRVKELGGLHVLGTERHEARRIDNQLRGRSGRQGDPGSSQFYVSLEDDLMRIFGGDKIKSIMSALNVPEDEPIQANVISRSIESAQEKIEGFNFDARHHLLEYDDVMNKHREIIYKKRKMFLENFQNNLRDYILDILKKSEHAEEDYFKKEMEIGQENMHQLEKFVALQVIDNLWQEHLSNMEHIKDSVRLRAYGGKDPLVEYKSESRREFQQLLMMIDANIAENIMKIGPQKGAETARPNFAGAKFGRAAANPATSNFKNVGRNDPCPCGSGKKFKKCHGS